MMNVTRGAGGEIVIRIDGTFDPQAALRLSLRPATIVIADQGRKSAGGQIKRLLENGQRVLAVDPFYFGESTIPERDALYALLMAAVGERPLGVQAGQIAAIARGCRPVAPRQINFLMPTSVPTSGTADIQIVQNSTGQVLGSGQVSMNSASPALFAADGSGAGQLAALNQDNSVNSSGKSLDRFTVR